MATIPIFDGTNYKIWSVKMQTLFSSMDLWDAVRNGYNHKANRETDEETDEEIDEETEKKNQKKDATALFHIQQGVSDRIFPIIEDATAAKQAWDILFRFSTQELTWPDYRNLIATIDLRQTGANHLIVATLIATVALTAGFTMPGGYNGNDGTAILTRKAAFKAFIVTDTVAMSLSISAVLIHFFVGMTNNRDEVEMRVYIAAYLLIYAVVAMVLAFVTGTFAVLAHSLGLAISVCVIGCLPFSVFLFTNIRRIVVRPSAKARIRFNAP